MDPVVVAYRPATLTYKETSNVSSPSRNIQFNDVNFEKTYTYTNKEGKVFTMSLVRRFGDITEVDIESGGKTFKTALVYGVQDDVKTLTTAMDDARKRTEGETDPVLNDKELAALDYLFNDILDDGKLNKGLPNLIKSQEQKTR